MISGAELSVCIAHHRGHLFKGDRGESSPQMRLCIAIFGTTYKLYFIGGLLLPFQLSLTSCKFMSKS